MNNSTKTSKIWKGKFSYDPQEYGIVDDVDFELYVELTDSKFEGVVYDEEFRELCEILPKVKGFIEGDHISFVVTYPVAFSIDENDEISIDTSQKGHDVAYDGYYAANAGKWIGKWEILAKKIKNKEDEYYQHHSIGGWEITM